MLSPNWMVIGRQVKTAYDKKIDLLCMDRDGNLIVIELKRDMTERDTVAQALDYGSWVRTVKADGDSPNLRQLSTHIRTRIPSRSAINEAFCAHFRVREMPEDLNESHELVIVGSSFDPATKRIVGYLASAYGVKINAVFFLVSSEMGISI